MLLLLLAPALLLRYSLFTSFHLFCLFPILHPYFSVFFLAIYVVVTQKNILITWTWDRPHMISHTMLLYKLLCYYFLWLSSVSRFLQIANATSFIQNERWTNSNNLWMNCITWIMCGYVNATIIVVNGRLRTEDRDHSFHIPSVKLQIWMSFKFTSRTCKTT